MLSFNKIVNYLGSKSGKLFLKSEIYSVIDPELKAKYKSKVNKTIYRLKAEGFIVPIKAGVYIIPNSEDLQLNKIELLEKYYIKLLKKYISYYVGSKYYISGVKALEIHNKNYSIPEKIYIVNKDINKKVTLGDYIIQFKTVKGKFQGKSVNIFTKFEKFTEKKSIEGIDFKLAGLELALLESAVLTDIDESLNIKLLNKILKKYKSSLNPEVFYEIGKYKYIMSFNRLKELTKKIDEGLYLIFLDIIKKNGGLFIGEGLRGF